MPDDDLLQRLRRFQDDAFPLHEQRFRALVDEGQHPATLFIGCSDSRLVPYLLTGTGPGELFLVRNVGAFVPPYDGSHGHHGTAAAIVFSVLNPASRRGIVCGHGQQPLRRHQGARCMKKSPLKRRARSNGQTRHAPGG